MRAPARGESRSRGNQLLHGAPIVSAARGRLGPISGAGGRASIGRGSVSARARKLMTRPPGTMCTVSCESRPSVSLSPRPIADVCAVCHFPPGSRACSSVAGRFCLREPRSRRIGALRDGAIESRFVLRVEAECWSKCRGGIRVVLILC